MLYLEHSIIGFKDSEIGKCGNYRLSHKHNEPIQILLYRFYKVLNNSIININKSNNNNNNNGLDGQFRTNTLRKVFRTSFPGLVFFSSGHE